MITVHFNDKDYEIQKGKKVIDFIKENLEIEDIYTIMACKINNEVKSLNYFIEEESSLELIDYTRSDGSRIYIRGLTFIMRKALEEWYH